MLLALLTAQALAGEIVREAEPVLVDEEEVSRAILEELLKSIPVGRSYRQARRAPRYVPSLSATQGIGWWAHGDCATAPRLEARRVGTAGATYGASCDRLVRPFAVRRHLSALAEDVPAVAHVSGEPAVILDDGLLVQTHPFAEPLVVQPRGLPEGASWSGPAGLR